MILPKRWLCLFAVLAGLLACGDGRGNIKTSRLKSPPQPSSQISRYPEFWDAMGNMVLDFDARNAHEQAFAGAMHDIRRGRYGPAITLLQQVLDESSDHELKAQSAKMMGHLLRAQGRWQDLIELGPVAGELGPDLVEETELLMARHFRPLPPEVHRFDQHPAIVPTRIARFGQPIVEVEIAGETFDFWIDTGAGFTVLSRETADRVGIETLSREPGSGHTSTSKRVDVWPAIVPKLRVGGFVLENHRVAILETEDLQFKIAGVPLVTIEGILGWPVFERVAVEIDYAGGTTTFHHFGTDSEGNARGRGGAGGEKNLFWMGYPMVTALDPEGVPLHFGLDTGAMQTSLKSNALTKLGLLARPAGSGRRFGAGGSERVDRQQVDGFAMILDGVRVDFEQIGMTEGAKDATIIRPDGVLGADVLRDARVNIDMGRRRFELNLR